MHMKKNDCVLKKKGNKEGELLLISGLVNVGPKISVFVTATNSIS